MKPDKHTFPTLLVIALLSACGGGGGNEDDTPPAAAANIIFATSTSQDANLGGLGGADAICNSRAAAAGMPGNYLAWLSTSSVNAIDRFAGVPGWVRPDGLPVASSLADLIAGKMYYPPQLDEFGVDIGSITVMTGTLSDGTVRAGFTCSDWNSTAGSVHGGDAAATTNIWTQFATGSCSAARRFYCLGTDAAIAVAAPSDSGRLAFLSSANIDGDVGLAGADTLCNNDAALATLPGSYKALLATQTATAASRFDLTGLPWVRLDGTTVVAQASDLAGPEQFQAPLNLEADGVTYAGNNAVWTGAANFNSVGAGSSCTDWTSTLGNGGITRAAKSIPRSNDTTACNLSIARLFCLQE